MLQSLSCCFPSALLSMLLYVLYLCLCSIGNYGILYTHNTLGGDAGFFMAGILADIFRIFGFVYISFVLLLPRGGRHL